METYKKIMESFGKVVTIPNKMSAFERAMIQMGAPLGNGNACTVGNGPNCDGGGGSLQERQAAYDKSNPKPELPSDKERKALEKKGIDWTEEYNKKMDEWVKNRPKDDGSQRQAEKDAVAKRNEVDKIMRDNAEKKKAERAKNPEEWDKTHDDYGDSVTDIIDKIKRWEAKGLLPEGVDIPKEFNPKWTEQEKMDWLGLRDITDKDLEEGK